MHEPTSEQAKKLLDDAGWAPGADGIREKDGVRASMYLYYSAGDTVRQGIADGVRQPDEGTGALSSTIKGASWDDLYPHQFTDPVVWGWGTNAPIETYNLFYSKGTGNYACYENAASRRVPGRGAGLPEGGGLLRLVEEGPVGRHDRHRAAGRRALGVVRRTSTICTLRRRSLKVAEQKPHPHGHGWSLVNNVDQWSWA